jgi:hypothetical protein
MKTINCLIIEIRPYRLETQTNDSDALRASFHLSIDTQIGKTTRSFTKVVHPTELVSLYDAIFDEAKESLRKPVSELRSKNASIHN